MTAGFLPQIDILLNEHFINASPPAWQESVGSSESILIVPESQGERTLTIPGRNERDFAGYGLSSSDSTTLALRIADALKNSQADSLRLPLLAPTLAQHLVDILSSSMPNWRFDAALAATSPVALKDAPNFHTSQSLNRALRSARNRGISFDDSARFPRFPRDEFEKLHCIRWGSNRKRSWFQMLELLSQLPATSIITARDAENNLVSCQFDITYNNTRHYYCSASNVKAYSGIGTGILAASWNAFIADSEVRNYCFGRGTERYKFRYANGVRELYELRGFYQPVSIIL